MGLSHSPRIVTDGLVLCLDAANKRSYPGAGTTWTDLKGANNGTLTNGPTFDVANGGSIVFDGSNQRVDTGVNPATLVGNGNPVTISAWFYSYTTSQRMFLGQGSSGRFYIEQYNRSGSLVAHWGFGDSQNSATSQAFISINTWYNYTATYDGSIAKGYLNGINTDTTSIGGPKGYSGSLSVGSWGPSGGFYFSGRISTVNVYNRALTADEIRQNYLATKGRYE